MILREGVTETSRKESASMDAIAALRGDLTKLGLASNHRQSFWELPLINTGCLESGNPPHP